MLAQLGWFALGLFVLTLGADSLLKGAAGLALGLGVRPFIIGLTIVGFGTSLPELTVNLAAAQGGNFELALGNVIGSNIANIGLILGVAALVAPLRVQMRALRIETPLLIGVSAGFWLLARDGMLSRIDGNLLLLGFAGLIVFVVSDVRREPARVQAELAEAVETRSETWRSALRIVIGLAALLYGAKLTLDSAVELARLWGMSELLIGLTLVAVGTSLPELASSALAAKRGMGDIAIGNVVGSCLFNILLILGLSSTLHPMPVSAVAVWIDIPLMVVFAAALWPLLRGDLVISRREGWVLLGAWLALLGVQIWQH